jgi:light-regulated signal transduction histidine kinase (bacteriophytochrome)
VECIIEDGLTVRGDRHLLEIVLDNLFRNAWKFTGKKPKATIEFGRTEHDGHSVFFVRDNGAGFDMTYAIKLFLPFQRLHSAEEFSGTGVGLPLVKRIIERHGGSVWGEGAVDKGATFYFRI